MADAKGVTVARIGEIEVFVMLNGVSYVRCAKGETPDLILPAKTLGLAPLELRLLEKSSTVKRAERKARRVARELKRRGYSA